MKKNKQKLTHHKQPLDEIDEATISQTITFSATEKSLTSDWTKIFLTWIFVTLIILFVVMDELLLAGLISLIGLTLAIISTAPAQTIHYSFDRKGITCNKRPRFWHEFRAFTITVLTEDVKITLWPINHYGLPVIIHAPYTYASQAIRHIGYHLPQQKGVGESLSELFLRVTRL